MNIILSHRYLDFDALASMVAAQKIYPDALIVIEGTDGSFVQDFLSLAKEQIPYFRLKDIDIDKIKKIILVDTYELGRAISNKKTIERLKNVELEVIDHHPYQNLQGINKTVELVGACTTLIVEKIMQKGLRLSSFDATLLALGIYDDTGSLLFENTTARDLRAVAFLLEQGAQLNVIAEYLRKPLSNEQMDLFQQLLDNGVTEIYEKTPVYISSAETQEYLGGLALLIHKIGEIESADVLFIVVKMENRIYIVGRARGINLPVNKILHAFGGSGHEKAASAVVKESDLQSVLSRLKQEIIIKVEKPSLVRDIMSFPVKTISPETTMGEISKLLLKYGHTGVPVVNQENKLVGVISRRDVDKALKHGLEHAPVKGFMTKEVISVKPDQSWEEVEQLMVEYDIGRVPVVEKEQLVGIVSRSDVLRLIYGSAIPTTTELAKQRSVAIREDILELIDQLPEKVKTILKSIQEVAAQLNYHVYLVGGFVRDLLLRHPTSDLDIVVEGDAIEFATMLGLKYCNSKIIPHKTFGTANILIEDGFHIDIAGSRREDYDYPGALPKVEESNLKDDLFRRDFTINAMALCLNKDQFGEIIDYYGGFRDLIQGEIRFLHNFSFIEDRTRIIRAVRFAGRYNFKLAKITKDAIYTALNENVLKKISAERFTEEIMLIFEESNYQEMGNKLVEYGVLSNWFGASLAWNFSVSQKEVIHWSIEKRWLVSLINIDDDGINMILKSLKINRDLYKSTLIFVNLRRELEKRILDLNQIDELLYNVARDLVEVFLYYDKYATGIKKYLDALVNIQMTVDGKKLLELGFNEGPLIGNLLKQIRTQWLLGKIANADQENEYIKKILKNLMEKRERKFEQVQKRIFSGMRPTGQLHIGHLSVLQNWVALQDEYDSFYSIVDWHALTTSYQDKTNYEKLIKDITLDWLSVGLDPAKCAIFRQSHVKEHAELHLLFSMFTPISWLERVPTYKDQIQQLGSDGKDLHTYGFLGYPLLQAADILVYKADIVPVGEDQIPHIELCREIARRFNFLYENVFPEPQALIGKVPLLPGVDGRKMSKSYNNAISLTASTEEISSKVRQMITDPQRIRKDDPGHPDVCVVSKFHQIYTPDYSKVEEECVKGGIGCVACKKYLAENIDKVLRPYREKRHYWEEDGRVENVLLEGAEKAMTVAADTMKKVRKAMGI